VFDRLFLYDVTRRVVEIAPQSYVINLPRSESKQLLVSATCINDGNSDVKDDPDVNDAAKTVARFDDSAMKMLEVSARREAGLSQSMAGERSSSYDYYAEQPQCMLQ